MQGRLDKLSSFGDVKGLQAAILVSHDMRAMIGCHVGDRSKTLAQHLWLLLPLAY